MSLLPLVLLLLPPWSGAASLAVCPVNLPCFQWTGMVHNPAQHVFSDVGACLVVFQDVLFAHGLDMDAHFLRLVPQQLGEKVRKWYDQFLLGFSPGSPSYQEFKGAITSRFGRSSLQEQADCALRLVKLVMDKGENVHSYVDRFRDLRRRSGDQTVPTSILIDTLLKALPLVFKERFAVVHAVLPAERKGDVDSCRIPTICFSL